MPTKVRKNECVWLYWETPQGRSDSPVIRLCRDIIHARCGRDVHLVTPDNLSRYLPDLPVDPDRITLKDGRLEPIAVKAGYIRIKLLQKYGGIWIDSDCILVQSPAETVLPKLDEYDFFAVRLHAHGRIRYANNFMGARAGSDFINEYAEIVERILSGGEPLRWGEIGADSLTPLVGKHRDRVYVIDEKQVHPITHDVQHVFMRTVHENLSPCVREYVNDRTLAVMLFHDTIHKMEGRSAYECISGDSLLSAFIRYALQGLDVRDIGGLTEQERYFCGILCRNFRNYRFQDQVYLPENNLLYQSISKCGGSSIKELLYNIEHAPEAFPEGQNPHDSGVTGFADRFNAMTVAERFALMTGPDTYRFTFVRNPFRRLLSAYYNRLLYCGPEPYEDTFGARRAWLGECARVESHGRPRFPALEKPSFKTFIEHVCSEEAYMMNRHWLPMVDAALIGTVEYDFIGKVENFAADIRVVLDRVGVSGATPIPRRNASRRKLDLAEYYTPELEKLVAGKYGEDFETFGYPDRIGKAFVAMPEYPDELFSHGQRLDFQHERQTIVRKDVDALQRAAADNDRTHADLLAGSRANEAAVSRVKAGLAKANAYIANIDGKVAEQANAVDGARALAVDIRAELARARTQLNRLESNINTIQKESSRLKSNQRKRALAEFRAARGSVGKKLKRFLRSPRLNEVALIHDAQIIDPYWYWEHNPRALDMKISVAEHYVRYGAAAGVNPTPDFDTVQYLMDHPALLADGLNPLVHYLLYEKH